MIRDIFSRIMRTAGLHRKRINICALVAFLLLGGSLFLVPLNPSLNMMLPSGGDSLEMIKFFEQMEIAGKVILSITPKDERLDRHEFLARVDEFAAALEPPLVTDTISNMSESEMVGGMKFFVEQAPALLSDSDWREIEARMTPAGTEELLRGHFARLMRPEGAYLAEMIRRDPLDIQSGLLERIQRLSTSFGYSLRIEDQHIFSMDGRHLLMILETPVPFTDSEGSRQLIDYIKNRQARILGSGIAVDIICGHMHSLSNEHVIRSDISRTMTFAGIAFALLFLFWFKDVKAVFVFLIPFAGLLVAIPATAVLTGAVSAMILGFGCVIAGISVDYGIHSYIAIWQQNSPVNAVLAIVRPLTVSALTTAAVFVAFFVARIEAYHQLAILALVSIFVSLAAAIFLLPLLIRPGSRPPATSRVRASRRMPPKLIAFLFLFLLSICIPLAVRVPFNGDIAELDGSEPEVFESEASFREIWGGGEQDMAVVAVEDEDYETAFEQGYRIYRQVAATIGADEVSSFYSVWKPLSQRRENVLRWAAFWSPERRRRFEHLLRTEGAKYGFAENAFTPFFDALDTSPNTLDAPSDNLLFEQLEARFVQRRDDAVTILMFVPDTEAVYAKLATLAEHNANVKLVSRRVLSRNLTADYSREIVRIASVAAVLMLLAVFLLMGRGRLALIAIAPMMVALPATLAILTLVQVPLNVVSLIAAIVVSGLCIDYGIFYTYAYAHRLDTGTPTAVALSAGTTLLGAGVLLLANHPALFYIGLTLGCGVSIGYLAARLLIPALCRLCNIGGLS